MEFRPLGPRVGVEIAGVDLSGPLEMAQFDAIERALDERLVTVVPGQTLTAESFIAFARRFGRPEPHVIDQFHHPEDPNVLILSNVRLGGEPIGLEDAGTYFHSDYSYLDTPARCTILYAIQVPSSEKSGTSFADQRSAWEDLPADEQRAIDGLVVRHHYGNRDNLDEATRTVASPLTGAQKDKVHWVRHPLVRVHPGSGRKSLYAVSGSSFEIEGMDEAEGRALLDRLARHAVQPRYLFRRPYAVGDVVVWDNCCLLHSAPLIDRTAARTLWRATVMDRGPTLPA